MTLLCAFLLEPENAEVKEKLVQELDAALSPLRNNTQVYPHKDVGDKLPYFAACLVSVPFCSC